MNMNAAVARSLVRFASRGITLDEARTLPVIFGCVGTGIQGKGSYVTFEGQPNLAKLVEFAMYDGYDPHTDVDKRQPPTRGCSRPERRGNPAASPHTAGGSSIVYG